MFGWGRRREVLRGVSPNAVDDLDGEKVVDVRGQTCPGYLLAINRAMDSFPPGTPVRLWITYPACGDDVQAWANSRGHTLHGIEYDRDRYVIRLTSSSEGRKADRNP